MSEIDRRPKRYEILRQVENEPLRKIPMPEKPKQVWTLLVEERFHAEGLLHWHTAFIEDSTHDWDWDRGQFRFYGHSGARGDLHDLVIVYEK